MRSPKTSRWPSRTTTPVTPTNTSDWSHYIDLYNYMLIRIFRSLFSLLYEKCSSSERRLYFLFLGFNFGMQMNLYIGFPLWFQEPVFIC